jgi:hypothetical protein
MNQQIKDKMEEVVTNESLTKEQRDHELLALVQAHFAEQEAPIDIDKTFDEWNNAMAEIVERRGLGRH